MSKVERLGDRDDEEDLSVLEQKRGGLEKLRYRTRASGGDLWETVMTRKIFRFRNKEEEN